MRKKLATVALVVVMGFLLVTNSAVAQAARLITGKDIKDNSVTTKDVKDGSLIGADFDESSLPQGPQGEPGEDGVDGEQGPPGEDGVDGVDGQQGPAGPGAVSLNYTATSNDSGSPLGVADGVRYSGNCSYNAGSNTATASLSFFRPAGQFGVYGLTTTTIDNAQTPQYNDVALSPTANYLVSASASLNHTVRAYASPYTLTFNGTPDNRTQEISVRVAANVTAANTFTCRITGTVTPATLQQ